ncbi:MAG: sigma-70 family RNA polymerase sigma factor [Armatimonadota bacterium]
MAMTAPSAQTEIALIRRVQQGDGVAFDRLVELYSTRVYNLAYRMIGNAEDAQDAAQEAFLRIYDALPKFRGDASFSTWMHRIVVNVCHDEMARKRRRPPTLTEITPEDGDGGAPAEQATTGETAEDAVLRQERRQALHQAITALPPPFREVLVLYDLQGFSYDEISQILRVNIGTVKSRLNRARNLLREKIRGERELFGIADSRSR